MAITVTGLAMTPVKGMRLRAVDAVELSELAPAAIAASTSSTRTDGS
jgi:hypothetical protein